MDKIIIILGPTAVGKTEISLLLAERIEGEIISADAFQVYRGMDIGTAKPNSRDLSRIPHHLIDILDLSQKYNAARFRTLALSAVEDIKRRGNIPLVIGGSGLYLKVLVDGLFQSPPADQGYRSRLQREAEIKGSEFLHNLLLQKDPVTAQRIHPNNLKRVIRALEVIKLTGIPMSQWQQQWRRDEEAGSRTYKDPTSKLELAADKSSTGKETQSPRRSNINSPEDYFQSEGTVSFRIIGLRRPRGELYKRIDRRVREMFDHGLVEETKSLLGKGLLENPVARQALGYKEIVGYLAGDYDRDEAIKQIATNTRHFAKRQLTWWRKDARIEWIDISEGDPPRNIVGKIMKIMSS